MSNTVWNRKRDAFLEKIEITKQEQEEEQTVQGEIVLDDFVNNAGKKTINVDSCVLLVYAAESDNGQILVSSNLEGKDISVNNMIFTKNRDKKIVARWISALSELVNQGYVKSINSNIYEVTYSGYNFAEQIKDEFAIDTTYDFEKYLVD